MWTRLAVMVYCLRISCHVTRHLFLYTWIALYVCVCT